MNPERCKQVGELYYAALKIAPERTLAMSPPTQALIQVEQTMGICSSGAKGH